MTHLATLSKFQKFQQLREWVWLKNAMFENLKTTLKLKTQISEPQNRCLINVDYLYFNLDHSSNSLDEDAMILIVIS